jgi:hypothetical protein
MRLLLLLDWSAQGARERFSAGGGGKMGGVGGLDGKVGWNG